MQHCRRAPHQFLGLRGRLSNRSREWYVCERHYTVVKDMVRDLWLMHDKDGVMTFEEGVLP